MRTCVLLGLVLMLSTGSALAIGGVAHIQSRDIEPDLNPVTRTYDPLIFQFSFTQLNDPGTIERGTGVACASNPGFFTTENAWWRFYELDEIELPEGGDTIHGELCVKAVDYGVELSNDGSNLDLDSDGVEDGVDLTQFGPIGQMTETIEIGCYPHTSPGPDVFPYVIVKAFLVDVVNQSRPTANLVENMECTQGTPCDPDADPENPDADCPAGEICRLRATPEFREWQIEACCNADTQDLAVGIGSPNDCLIDEDGDGIIQVDEVFCHYYLAAHNDKGQSYSTFSESVSCGLPNPMDFPFGGPDGAVIQVIRATTSDALPASTAVSLLLLILTLLGGSTYCLRRTVKS